MKKEYTKPELDTKAFAQFENVFTKCDKGNAKNGCVVLVGWTPEGSEFAAFSDQGSVSGN